MKHWLGFFFLASWMMPVFSQSDLPGIRNTGFLPPIHVLPAADTFPKGKLFLKEKTTRVQLYPGFGVIDQTYLVNNEDSGAMVIRLGLPLEGSVKEPATGWLFFKEPHAVRLSLDGQMLHADPEGTFVQNSAMAPAGDAVDFPKWQTWTAGFQAGKATRVRIQAIIRTSLSRFVSGQEARDGNAFALGLEDSRFWKRDSTRQVVMVHMLEGLKLTDIWGIRPDSLVEGDFTNLLLKTTGYDGVPSNFLIWYQGAPPDFKFNKKVLPYPDTLYTIMERFPMESFRNGRFSMIRRNNFSLSPSGLTFSGVLYFLMFTVPWIILGGFIIFLLRGRKKKQH